LTVLLEFRCAGITRQWIFTMSSKKLIHNELEYPGWLVNRLPITLLYFHKITEVKGAFDRSLDGSGLSYWLDHSREDAASLDLGTMIVFTSGQCP
jgi:hypothetical protein